ncbi:MAG: tRNA (N(6)-L-threonylcarbamoyladenosine(37)-C(2))-methylthiotransferase MtaB [Anaerolineaceae bacterium]|nr:tRNA (N(6)-L-threonylcarbamoyladenosine(37)-C(2))-methylthiotransferase MtaB [Anaerolineaceae bacterium]
MKVFLDTIGCRLNQAEIEQMGAQLRQAGHAVVGELAEADLVIINTCAVTTAAASDSRQKIRQAARAGIEQMVVTGCWATLAPHAAADLPGVSRVVDNAEKENLIVNLLQVKEEEFDREPLARQPLPGAHLRTRAFIKVQDGCNNFCTFCITRLARGASRSRSTDEILKDISAALAGGAKEVVLTGVHLGSWGKDFSEKLNLRYLIEVILRESDTARLRLSSLEPWDLDETFFELWQDIRLCRHLHLPLQSGSAGVLKRMARKTTPQSFFRLVELARYVAPHMAVTTDLIAGFPGESEDEFAEGLALVEEIGFAGGHVFTYSPRPGTAAERMLEQVPHVLRKRRSERLRAALAESSKRYREQFLGETVEVLWESAHEAGDSQWKLAGLNDQAIKVTALSSERLCNQFGRVRIEKITRDGAEGILLQD